MSSAYKSQSMITVFNKQHSLPMMNATQSFNEQNHLALLQFLKYISIYRNGIGAFTIHINIYLIVSNFIRNSTQRKLYEKQEKKNKTTLNVFTVQKIIYLFETMVQRNIKEINKKRNDLNFNWQ